MAKSGFRNIFADGPVILVDEIDDHDDDRRPSRAASTQKPQRANERSWITSSSCC